MLQGPGAVTVAGIAAILELTDPCGPSHAGFQARAALTPPIPKLSMWAEDDLAVGEVAWWEGSRIALCPKL